MGFAQDRARISQQIEKYLRGRHDADKKYLGRMCLLSLQAAINYTEMGLVLRSYHDEMTRLVAGKNARRWFAHKAGELEKVFREGAEACVVPATNEARLVKPANAPNLRSTLADWNRHGEGTAYKVNGRPFAKSHPTEQELLQFFTEAGIANATLRTYLAGHFNQAGLTSGGALLTVMTMTRGCPVSNSATGTTNRHVIRSSAKPNQLHLRSEFTYDQVAVGDPPPRIHPPLTLAVDYMLVEQGGSVSIVDRRYELTNVDAVPAQYREAVSDAMESIEAPDLG